MMNLLQDLRFALRTTTKQPLFAAIAVLTIGLGIGANTAIFSVVHAVLIQPMPYPASPDEVLLMFEKSKSWDQISVAYPNFKDWQEENQSFEAMAGYKEGRYNMTGLDEPLRLRVRLVSSNYFGIMGVNPLYGRFFSADEDQPGAPGRAILNYSLWKNRFGGDSEVIGNTILLNDKSYSVIGILPAGFELTPRERVYIPLEPWADNASTRQRGNHNGIRVLARMKDEVSFEEARAEMKTIASRLEAQYPDTNTGIGVNVGRINDRRVEDFESTLLLLLGAVSLVLLIACTNVAQLLLARAMGRRREIAVQVALGAGRGRLVQQSLTEGVVLALMGGALGLAMAFSGFGILRGLLPSDVPRLDQVHLSGYVLAYTAAISILTGILFGSLPALMASRVKPMDSLKEGSRDTGGRSSAGRALLVAEMALATLLLIGASLLIRSVYELTRVDPGFRTERLLTMQIGLPHSRYEGEQRAAFLREMQAGVESLPGVISATVGLDFPMTGSRWNSMFIVNDHPVPPRNELPRSLFTPVAPSYFETFEIPLLRGRFFRDSDDPDGPPVVIINRTLADHFWPNENPVGKRLKQGWPENEGERWPWREIVGVAGDTKQLGLGEATRMQIYIPVNQDPPGSVRLALRTAIEPMTLVAPTKAAVHHIDPDVPVYEIETIEDVISTSIAPHRFTMTLLAIFAGLALVLAAIGLYGVISYTVSRRVREIGVRIALGARRNDVFGMVVRQGLGMSLLGCLLGVGGAFGLAELLSSLLYGVATRDAMTFLVASLVLMLVSFVACAVPALSATRVDPSQALMCE